MSWLLDRTEQQLSKALVKLEEYVLHQDTSPHHHIFRQLKSEPYLIVHINAKVILQNKVIGMYFFSSYFFLDS